MELRELKDGLSGFLRVKNEARFVGQCIESCIDALDELVVVYNDCTDGTPEILEEKRAKYPDKIRIYPYEHEVMAFHLTEEQYNFVKDLPEGSPQLFSTYSNFPLTKVRYKYVIKLDSDQLYFADEVARWKDLCGAQDLKWKPRYVFGWLFMIYFSLYRRISAKSGHPCLSIFPDWLVRLFFRSYRDYAGWRMLRGTGCIALSGFNVFKDREWYVPFDGENIHPPYNGEGDTVICRLSENTYFYKRLSGYIGGKDSYFVAEAFHCPYKMFFSSPVWFHLHALRDYCYGKVLEYKSGHPEQFVPIEKFPSMTYSEVLDRMDPESHTLYQRILFAFVHKAGTNMIKPHLYLLKNI